MLKCVAISFVQGDIWEEAQIWMDLIRLFSSWFVLAFPSLQMIQNGAISASYTICNLDYTIGKLKCFIICKLFMS